MRRIGRRHQEGIALPWLVALAAAVAAAVVAERLVRSAAPLREQATATALARGVEALAGYAATYRDTHPGEVFGYLPCPDRDGDGDADSPCEAADRSAVGRLPYKTLGLPAIRDGSGECLWYAVSGAFKNSPKSATAAPNWDTPGQFAVAGPRGGALADADDGAGGAAALVFAPGASLPTNSARAGGGECGGGNVATAYLEPGTGLVSTDARIEVGGLGNDRIAWVSPQELFVRRIRLRTDFQGDLTALLDTVSACFATGPLPMPVPLAGTASPPGRRIGRLPASACYATEYFRHYGELLFYVACDPPGACLRVNGTPCGGALLFAGEAGGGQRRRTATERNDAAGYLEDGVLAAFVGGGDFAGPARFAVATPDAPATADVVACLQPGGPP